MTSTDDAQRAIWTAQLANLGDCQYVIGTDGRLLHAVTPACSAEAFELDFRGRNPIARAACGRGACPIPKQGEFHTANPRFHTGFSRTRCPDCLWIAALAQHTETDELDLLEPRGTDRAPMNRLFPGLPLLTRQLCEAILARPGDSDPDHPYVAQLLSHVTTHAPTILLPEDCADGECDHDRNPAGECPFPDVSLACATCSVRAGGWAGEWVGQYAPECTVDAPCGVLRTVARHYDIQIGA